MRRTCRALSWTVRPLYTIGVLDRATGKLAKIEPPRCLPR
jgi:hypothetical protein